MPRSPNSEPALPAMFASKLGYKNAQTRFNLLLLEDGEFFLDVRRLVFFDTALIILTKG